MSDTASTPTSRAYNKVVDQLTVQVIADYFASIPTIFGLIQNNLSTPLSQALNRDSDWLDAIRRKDLVCAWHTLIEATLFKQIDRDTSISQIEGEIRLHEFTLTAFNNNLPTMNAKWASTRDCLLLCRPNYDQTWLVRTYASHIMDCSRDYRLLFNATSLALLSYDTDADPNIIAARTDLNKAQVLFENILLIDSCRTKPNNNINNINNKHKNHNHKVLNALLDRISNLENPQLQQLLNLTEQQTNDADTTANVTEPKANRVNFTTNSNNNNTTTTTTTTNNNNNNNNNNALPKSKLCTFNDRTLCPTGCPLKAACPNMHGPHDRRFENGILIPKFRQLVLDQLNKLKK
jgi:hypothetical protein